MQIFNLYSDSYKTALSLDMKRLNNQINEAKTILSAIEGAKAWKNHPVVLMYKEYISYLKWLILVFSDVHLKRRLNFLDVNIAILYELEHIKPPFIDDKDLIMSHRANLYKKDSEYYKDFGPDYNNWLDKNNGKCPNLYIVGDEKLLYINGRQIKKEW